MKDRPKIRLFNVINGIPFYSDLHYHADSDL